MTTRKQNIISVIIIVIGAIVAYVIFGPKELPINQEGSGTEVAPTMVEAMALKKNSSFELEKNVIFESEKNVKVLAEYAGRIESVNFQTGEEVKEGQILASFEQSADKNTAKVSFESAQKSLAIAEDNYEKTKNIADENIEIAEGGVDIAEEQYDQAKDSGDDSAEEIAKKNLEIAKDREDQAKESAKTQVNGAKLQLEQARLQFQQAKIQFNKTFIEAPVSGVISSKKIQPNDYLNPGMEIAEISGQGKVFAKIYLNEKEIGFITGNEDVYIQDGENKINARIESFSSLANSSNGRYEVNILADGNFEKIANKNMEATIIINLSSEREDSFFIPLNAVNIGQSRNQVFVSENGVAKSVEVTIDKVVDDQAMISGELEEGDLLIVKGNRDLQDGEKIETTNN